MSFNELEKGLLSTIADIESVPHGAFNLREDGKLAARNVTANIDIVSKTDKPRHRYNYQARHKGRKGGYPRYYHENRLERPRLQ